MRHSILSYFVPVPAPPQLFYRLSCTSTSVQFLPISAMLKFIQIWGPREGDESIGLGKGTEKDVTLDCEKGYKSVFPRDNCKRGWRGGVAVVKQKHVFSHMSYNMIR